METERPLSILPSIKCSDCGAEIQISAMGEHVCPSQQKEDQVSPKLRSPVASPATSPSIEQPRGLLPPNKQSLNRPPSRPNRTPLPRIDPSVASESHKSWTIRTRQLTGRRQAVPSAKGIAFTRWIQQLRTSHTTDTTHWQTRPLPWNAQCYQPQPQTSTRTITRAHWKHGLRVPALPYSTIQVGSKSQEPRT